MKKIIIATLVAAVATLSFAANADARDGGFRWHNHGWHNVGWRHDGWRYGGWRHRGWYGGFWGGPTLVIGGPAYYDDYCFVRKVRHYDNYGNVYIKRVRVCR